MKLKIAEFPRNIIAGHDVLHNIRGLCDALPFNKKITIIAGEKTRKIAGDQVCGYLDGYDIRICTTKEVSSENIEYALSEVRDFNTGLIIAVGGGSKIDMAKVVSEKCSLPFISIPTSASHDGIASNRASLKTLEGPVSKKTSSPMGIIADTSVIFKSPYRLLASGCADVVSNLTALKDWKFATRLRNEEFSGTAYTLSKYAAESIAENAEHIGRRLETSVWFAIKPIIVSGLSMCIADSSRPTSGAEHMISHYIDREYPGRALHGEQCGVASILTMYLHGGDWKMIRNVLQKIGAPTTARELKLDRDEIIDAMIHAHEIRTDRFTILGTEGISKDAAQTAAEETGVI